MNSFSSHFWLLILLKVTQVFHYNQDLAHTCAQSFYAEFFGSLFQHLLKIILTGNLLGNNSFTENMEKYRI